eukprot:1140537-Pelagomonas_calceolata.AAC.8
MDDQTSHQARPDFLSTNWYYGQARVSFLLRHTTSTASSLAIVLFMQGRSNTACSRGYTQLQIHTAPKLQMQLVPSSCLHSQ